LPPEGLIVTSPDTRGGCGLAAFVIVVGGLLVLFAAMLPLTFVGEKGRLSDIEWLFVLVPSGGIGALGLVTLWAGLDVLFGRGRRPTQAAPAIPSTVEAAARERFAPSAAPQPAPEPEGVQRPGEVQGPGR
jgi:hypothetical protein